MPAVKKVYILRILITRKKISIAFILCLYGMMDGHKTY